MKYEIAIPSYKRAKALHDNTLKILSSIPVENITIFVRNQEELDDYIKENGTEYNYIITEACGIKNTRNFIRTYYYKKELDLVISMDDDIIAINKLQITNDKKTIKSLSPEEFREAILYMYDETKKRNFKFFGLCVYNNPFYMNEKITTNLKLISQVYGIIEPHIGELHQCSVGEGEDLEFTMKHFLTDGGVVRFNNYSYHSKPFANMEGGMYKDLGGFENRIKQGQKDILFLENTYPEMCSRKLTNGKWKCKDMEENYRLVLNYRYKNISTKIL